VENYVTPPNTLAISYAAHGAIQQMTLGNGLVEKTQFNSRLQPTSIELTVNSSPLWSLGYGYGTDSTKTTAYVLADDQQRRSADHSELVSGS
jgi:hypothetical protein